MKYTFNLQNLVAKTIGIGYHSIVNIQVLVEHICISASNVGLYEMKTIPDCSTNA